MRVLIFEPDHRGHHLQYVRAIVDALKLLPSVEQIILVTDEDAPDSTEFMTHIKDAQALLIIDASIKSHHERLIKGHLTRYMSLCSAIRSHRPNHVYVPYADGLMQMSGLFNMVGLSWNRNSVRVEGLLMRGRFAYQIDEKFKKFRNWISLFPLRFAPFDLVHQLDPIAYKFVQEKCSGSWVRRCHLLPEAVERIDVVSKRTAREHLGINTMGRYIGCFGWLDTRKGVDLLLRAFAATSFKSTDRLLLMGRMEPSIEAILNTECAALVESGQIVVINEYVSQNRLHLGLNATDLVVTPYPSHIGSSGIVVRAAAVGRPVLGSTFGWVGQVVKDFKLGWVTNVQDIPEFSTALHASLDNVHDYVIGAEARRFTAFHTIENFKSHWTQFLRKQFELDVSTETVEWHG